MIPQFFVFVDKETDLIHLSIIKGLMDYGYCPFVDSEKGNNETWFTDNLKNISHRLYFHNKDGDCWYTEYGLSHFKKPDLLVAFSEGINPSEKDWEVMYYLVRSLNSFCKDNAKDLVEKALEIFERPLVVKPQVKNEETEVELPKAYGFRFASIGDVGFYEIVKPNVEEPYVTMVEDYKFNTMDMYTNFFKCQSWGVANSDIAFMKKLWIHHGEVGELDLDLEFEKRVKRVIDGGKEPLVWRNSLENVMDIYIGAIEVKNKKREKPDIQISNKKK